MTKQLNMLELECKKCGAIYEKSKKIKTWNERRPHVFFSWNLTYCDTCRRKRESEALKELPNIIIGLENL